MPHVNIWIRKEDFERWQAIKDKPSFIHNALTPTMQDVVKGTPIGLEAVNKAIKASIKDQKMTIRKANGLCKIHGTPLTTNGKCLQKKCKYS